MAQNEEGGFPVSLKNLAFSLSKSFWFFLKVTSNCLKREGAPAPVVKVKFVSKKKTEEKEGSEDEKTDYSGSRRKRNRRRF